MEEAIISLSCCLGVILQGPRKPTKTLVQESLVRDCNPKQLYTKRECQPLFWRRTFFTFFFSMRSLLIRILTKTWVSQAPFSYFKVFLLKFCVHSFHLVHSLFDHGTRWDLLSRYCGLPARVVVTRRDTYLRKY